MTKNTMHRATCRFTPEKNHQRKSRVLHGRMVFFVIEIKSRAVEIAGIRVDPIGWMNRWRTKTGGPGG